ncbi:MAG: IreB family regulatory phosphoprotein [Clostridiales bacterium]|nr:IreB family regulatory phosphoprotein [Clostridiales bacterium]
MNGETLELNISSEKADKAREILNIVATALKEKGYNPVNQIAGYLMSGDPTYITSFNGARKAIRQLERDEIIEELVKSYILAINE